MIYLILSFILIVGLVATFERPPPKERETYENE